ncbi:hypothetical protein GM31_03385 [Trabulsiella odontotermitis]|uniref:Uncharacterized protein n=2 Tax=Trabulsiella odontotermitis TaxID=379893 RepID=A0A0L0GUB9_9ENTR|nr:hypothetical protein GM31_03385 [Trabulsiella odontotermitis]KNC92028.1 hypothetical protein GM30_19500 [Trabulsiella odontotermitis]
MTTLKVQVDKDIEDDGLYIVTLWVDLTPPRYISVSRDAYEEPDVIYIEAQDQIYGKKTTNLRYSISDSILRLYFLPGSEVFFHWNNSSEVLIKINERDWEVMQESFKNIFSLGGRFMH